MARGRAVHGPDGRGMPPEAPADRCRADTAASRTGQARITPMAPARRPARRAGSTWRVSKSFPELAQAVLEHAQPDRIDIVRAKRHLLGQLGDGQPHPTGTLIASVATLLGAERLGRPQIALPSRDSVKIVVSGLFICTQDHDQRQRCLRGLPLTERYYPVGLTAAKPFRSPICAFLTKLDGTGGKAPICRFCMRIGPGPDSQDRMAPGHQGPDPRREADRPWPGCR